ncbi:MAG: phosphoribosylanthranilate isomerase [Lachnospiraceae bacterium]|nr:phosphoribosylanthranilate isomerase [Lachnospiraceae bacterium]
MTRIKLCGMMGPDDIQAANAIKPDYVGYVLAPGRKRTITAYEAAGFTDMLAAEISPVGVFVNEEAENVAGLLNTGVIRIAQLHGDEDEEYIRHLRSLTKGEIWKAFCIRSEEDIQKAEDSTADLVLLDSGTGTGRAFNWELIGNMKRPYLLAGGLSPDNVEEALHFLHPYGVDVSSGIERDGRKDPDKMAAFAAAVRKDGNR